MIHRTDIINLQSFILTSQWIRWSKEEYIKEAGQLISGIATIDMTAEHELFRIHLGIIDNNESIIESGLAHLERMAQDLHRKILNCIVHIYILKDCGQVIRTKGMNV